MKALEILVRITRTPQDLFRYSDKELNEAIAELEALQQPKSCVMCKKQDLPPIEQLMACGHCKQLAHDNFEPKDKL